jgi:enoyl-[acyl-carrier protein] reductase I
MNFLQVEKKKYIIFGLANKKSVACAIAKTLVEQGAEVIHVVRSRERVINAKKLFPDAPVFICDVEDEANIIRVKNEIEQSLDRSKNEKIAGLVHSIAFANYSEGMKPFHETRQADFLYQHSQSFQGSSGRRRIGCHHYHLDHQDGCRKLWLYGTDQGSS